MAKKSKDDVALQSVVRSKQTDGKGLLAGPGDKLPYGFLANETRKHGVSLSTLLKKLSFVRTALGGHGEKITPRDISRALETLTRRGEPVQNSKLNTAYVQDDYEWKAQYAVPFNIMTLETEQELRLLDSEEHKSAKSFQDRLLQKIGRYDWRIRTKMPRTCSSGFFEFARNVRFTAAALGVEQTKSEGEQSKKSVESVLKKLVLARQGADYGQLSRLITLLFLQLEYWNSSASRADFNEAQDDLAYMIVANKFDPAIYIGILNMYLDELFDERRAVSVVTEGVTEERSGPVSEEDKLENARLAPIFEGQLDRESMAEALKAAMDERGLSVRKAANEAEVSASVISQIKVQEASIDQAAKVLDQLGFEVELTVRPKDYS